jgi:hypothetical protein
MEDSIRENGKIIKWKVMESLPGLIIGDTKVNTLMIRKRVMECSFGQMEESMKDNGKTESNTVLVSTLQLQEKQRKGNGLKAKE